MLDNLRQIAESSQNFLDSRWDNPLHSNAATEVQGRLWPCSEDFYHPLNPMFSCFFRAQEHLELFKVVMLRDGALMLLDFFFRFPVPKGKVAKFLIPAELSFLIPMAWRPHVLCYRNNYADAYTKPLKKLLFITLLSETSLSWNKFKFVMPHWLKHFPKEAEVSAYFGVRSELLDDVQLEKKLSFEFVSTFQEHFNNKPEIIESGDIRALSTISDTTLINCDVWNCGISLCTLENFFASQAVQVYPRGIYKGFQGKKIGEWPVSFSHSLSIYTAQAQDTDYENLLFTKKTAIKPRGFLPYPVIPQLLQLLQQRLTLTI
jgi:hypothetical protein